MYPKQIADALRRAHPEWFAARQDEGTALTLAFADGVRDGDAVEDAVFELASSDPAIAAYLDYLRDAKAAFREIATSMGYWNPVSSHSLRHDAWSVGWAGDALLPIANYLYVLQSFGVRGDCLEAGAFKGSSTACLSYVCSKLGLTLYCADSFAGLPSSEGHYGTGDFAGSREEVEANVRAHGVIGAVRFIEGWYAESLRGFSAPLSLIWTDVDLQQSVLDVLQHTMPCLVPDGVIFSDGFTEGVDFTPDHRIVFTGSEPAGFHRYFRDHAMDAIALPAAPGGLTLILPHPERTPWLWFDRRRFERLVNRL